MIKINYPASIIFKGVEEEYYGSEHNIEIDELNHLQLHIKDCRNYLLNPKPEHKAIIDRWRSLTDLKIKIEGVSYIGTKGLSILRYLISSQNDKQYLIILGFDEGPPTIYTILVEEIWLI